MNGDKRLEQLFVCVSRLVDPPPGTALSGEELASQHHAFIKAQEDKGILFGAGSAKDEKDVRHAGGVVILDVDSLAEAQAIMASEPYIREGQRAVDVVPWQRTWFGG